jgi:hypothetical protein
MKFTTQPAPVKNIKQLINAKEYKHAFRNYTEANLKLHKIGNQAPYFSLTGRVVNNGLEYSSGWIIEDILQAFPQLADVAALHLSDINGLPMHSFENGKYWAGFTKHEAGNAKHLASLWRISEDEAKSLFREALEAKAKTLEEHGELIEPLALLKSFHDKQIPRWKEEAEKAIEKYKLEVVED